jgi:hypothetical protein
MLEEIVTTVAIVALGAFAIICLVIAGATAYCMWKQK